MTASEAVGSDRVNKESLVRRLLPFQNRVVNPVVVAPITRGLAPATCALLETKGRRTGRFHHTPPADGLEGNTFWLIAGRGEKASTPPVILARRSQEERRCAPTVPRPRPSTAEWSTS